MAIVQITADEKSFHVQVEMEHASDTRLVAITQSFSPKTTESLKKALDVAQKYSKVTPHSDGKEAKIVAGFKGGEMIELVTEADLLQVFLALS